MPQVLSGLPDDRAAREPYIDAQTIRIHHEGL